MFYCSLFHASCILVGQLKSAVHCWTCAEIQVHMFALTLQLSFIAADLGSGTTALANGATCTHHNQCSGNACLQCPGDAGHICYTGKMI